MPVPEDYVNRQIILLKPAAFRAQRRRHFLPDEPNNMIAWAPVDPPRLRPEPLPLIQFPAGTMFSNLMREEVPAPAVSGLSNPQADGYRYFVSPIPGAEDFQLGEAAGPENIARYEGGGTRKRRSRASRKQRKQRGTRALLRRSK